MKSLSLNRLESLIGLLQLAVPRFHQLNDSVNIVIPRYLPPGWICAS
jgi:hypothetical protein